MTSTDTIDGVAYNFVAETHTVWGAHPERPPSPHKGISVYFAELLPDDGDTNPST